MAYRPNQIDEHDRSRSYTYMWFAVASSPINLICVLYGVQFWVFGIVWGFTMGGLVLAAIGPSNDEFMQSRLEFAMRFVVGAVALYLALGFIINTGDIAHSAGYALAAEEAKEPTGLVGVFWTDALTLASVLSVIFYAGYVVAVWREGRA